jgi:hypothetical protein
VFFKSEPSHEKSDVSEHGLVTGALKRKKLVEDDNSRRQSKKALVLQPVLLCPGCKIVQECQTGVEAERAMITGQSA